MSLPVPAGLADGLGREGALPAPLGIRPAKENEIHPDDWFPRSFRPARLLKPESNRLGNNAGATRPPRQTSMQLLAPQGALAGRPGSAASRSGLPSVGTTTTGRAWLQ